jgi:hypothetical protein
MAQSDTAGGDFIKKLLAGIVVQPRISDTLLWSKKFLAEIGRPASPLLAEAH